jgi:hypothetical protein
MLPHWDSKTSYTLFLKQSKLFEHQTEVAATALLLQYLQHDTLPPNLRIVHFFFFKQARLTFSTATVTATAPIRQFCCNSAALWGELSHLIIVF